MIDALYSVASTPEQKQLVQNVQSASDVSGNIHDANELEHGLAKGTVKIGVYFGVPAMILVGMIVAIKNEL